MKLAAAGDGRLGFIEVASPPDAPTPYEWCSESP